MPDGATSLPLIPFPATAAAGVPVVLRGAVRIAAPAAFRVEAGLLAEAIAARTGLPTAVTADADADVVFVHDASMPAEAYTLATGAPVVITAATGAGAMWGAQTLRQLLTADGEGWAVRGATVVDAPRFAYRGAMLDVARHFFSVADVCAYIDRISAYKINVLHLHLTDDQGWRLEIDGFPALTDRAASSAANGDPGGFYTQDDYREIVAYAALRHITVVPEIDTPGHTHAVGVAYPELAEHPVIGDMVREQAAALGQALPAFGEAYTGWGVGFSSVKIGDAATNAFLDEVFRQVAALTPGPWVHLGGDECLGTAPADFSAFVDRTSAVITALGKTPVAWHEAGSSAGLAPGTVGQYWGFRTPHPDHADDTRTFVARGGSVIMSPADAAYLDMKYDSGTRLGLTWADGPTSLERANDWDPARVVDGITDAQLLGVEAPMWTETISTFADIDEMAFPRLPIIADIAWSPADAPTRAWDSVRVRLAAQTDAWKAEGITFHPSREIA